MYVWDDEWLARHTEDILAPDLKIVDPHHHLWQREGVSTYLVDDLSDDTASGHNVVSTVYVECAWGYYHDGPEKLRPVGETETVATIAEEHSLSGGVSEIAGIVSFADLTMGVAVDDVLEAHIQAGRGRFRGIRHATAFDPSPEIRRTHTRPPAQLMADVEFREGIRCLARRALSFDAWLYHPQIPELTALARAVPECTFVLDHLGGMLGVGPYSTRRSEILTQWRADMAELATCANVVVKLGGIGMVIFGLGFEHRDSPPSSVDLVAAWGGPIEYAIEQFGPDRCMFESNFPVDRMSCSYAVLWNAFKRIAAGMNERETAALFSGTATRVYRL